MILTAHVDSFKSYLDNPALVLEIAWPCPACQMRSLSRHAVVLRWIYFADVRRRITVYRLRCRPCRVTATLLPDFLVPYTRYATEVVEAAAGKYLGEAGGLRAVAMAISGTVVPPELALSNPTDAIEMLKLKPGYQRIGAWIARIVERAAADVAAAAAWVTARVPTSIVVDQLTTPLPPSMRRRDDLDAGRMLVRLFTAVPELNPGRTGWLAAWLRFVAIVLGRTPWRGPPRSPPKPRSS